MNQSTPGRLRTVRTVLGAAALAAALWWLVGVVEGPAVAQAWAGLQAAPFLLGAALCAYAAAFALRSVAWTTMQPALSRGQAWAAIHVSLLGNHVLPLRLGEVLRVTSVLRRTNLAPRSVIASVVTLRLGDVLALLAVAVIATPVALVAIVGGPGAIVIAVLLIAAFAVSCWWLVRNRSADGVRVPGPVVVGATVVAWLLEAAVLFTVGQLAGLSVSPGQAAGVTAITVFAQIVAVTPGGFGTYEAAGTAALVALGFGAPEAFAVVLLTHGVKTAYALAVGGIALFAPAPGYWGRWRLPRSITPAATTPTATPATPATQAAVGAVGAVGATEGRSAQSSSGDAAVVVFLPAHNEEDVIASVIGRIPDRVHGHRVEVLVIDDGSTDESASRAAGAGAEVISLPSNEGLGAAVRRGLALATEREALAGVYLDADGEYPPEQIPDVVGPVLSGDADYVIGSRFAGTIETMLPHRRLGNLTLTRWLRWTARRPDITDGQSGFRAFSPAALRSAEVVHDYNYAQVLTLDLLGKGFVYAEVPIRYQFRTTGKSFISLGRYLRMVIPAVHRELNNSTPSEQLKPSPSGAQ
ncbi:hypothetical protein BH23ACT6_BH23ACT6_24690 [soil metagenome]